MNWKLIFGLSLFGLAMAFGTVFAISPRVEPFFWLVIFVICAFVIARQAALRPFVHGLLLGIANSVWIIGAHLLFFNRYLAGHPQEATMMSSSHAALPPKLLMAIVGPVIGVVSGVVIGVLAYVVAKVLKSGKGKESTKPRRAPAGS
ncbi:MAG TPA: hypothetical protein VKB26_05125 [Candidatus Acidoferrales bacterium]|nr:hypothetical protein [Candidatus Acidoferrales bacterium]